MTVAYLNVFQSPRKLKIPLWGESGVFATLLPVLNDSGIITAFVAVKEDISEQEQAEKATKSKSAFLANMSHEISTPMNAILGYLELTLEDKTLPAHLQKHLAIALTSADTLLLLINDIFDISKLESGKFTVEHRQFSLHQVIQACGKCH